MPEDVWITAVCMDLDELEFLFQNDTLDSSHSVYKM